VIDVIERALTFLSPMSRSRRPLPQHGVSAARRLLEDEESRFSSSYFVRRFVRTHAPPCLPRLMAHRQMVQLMNAASMARKETRKTRYNMAQTTLVSSAPAPTGSHGPTTNGSTTSLSESAGRSVKSLFQSSGRLSSVSASSSGGAYEFDASETRLRETLLKSWAAQLPIPTRAVQLTRAEIEEDREAERAASASKTRSPSGSATPGHDRTGSTASHPSRHSSRAHSRANSTMHQKGISIGSIGAVDERLAEEFASLIDVHVPGELEELIEEEDTTA
jgi:hypothetical protein